MLALCWAKTRMRLLRGACFNAIMRPFASQGSLGAPCWCHIIRITIRRCVKMLTLFRSTSFYKHKLQFILQMAHESLKTGLLKIHGLHISETVEYFFYAVTKATVVVRIWICVLTGCSIPISYKKVNVLSLICNDNAWVGNFCLPQKTQCISMMRCLDNSNLLVVSKLSHILTNK